MYIYLRCERESVCVFLWSADTRYTVPGDGNFSSSARQPSKYQMCVSPFLQNKQTNTQKGMRRRVSKSDDDNDRYWFSSFSLCSLSKKNPALVLQIIRHRFPYFRVHVPYSSSIRNNDGATFTWTRLFRHLFRPFHKEIFSFFLFCFLRVPNNNQWERLVREIETKTKNKWSKAFRETYTPD